MKAAARIAALLAVICGAVVADQGAGLSTAAGPPPDVAPLGRVHPRVTEMLRQQDKVGVIIALREPPADRARPLNLAQVRDQVEAVQDRALAAVTPAELDVTYRYGTVAAIAGTATQAAVDKLAMHPDVVAVTPDVARPLALAESAPLINADDAHTNGITGLGVVAAVLDTGIDTDHPDLLSSLVGEECFLQTAVAEGGNPCPGGGGRQSGAGAAEDDDGHGTAVAGIVTGDGGVAPLGIAPDASVFAYKICSTNVPPQNDTRCFDSDWLAALDDIKDNHPEVRAINMSIGGGSSATHCDASNPAAASTIGQLRNAGALTFIASGNSGDKSGIAEPACYSTSVSVGAVYDSNVGNNVFYPSVPCTDATTAADQVVCHSQSAAILDLLAPGGCCINTAALGGGAKGPGLAGFGGTSAAAPHATGCAALILQWQPLLSANGLEARLKAIGPMITDVNAVETRRIDCLVAAVGGIAEAPALDGPAPRATGQSGKPSPFPYAALAAVTGVGALAGGGAWFARGRFRHRRGRP